MNTCETKKWVSILVTSAKILFLALLVRNRTEYMDFDPSHRLALPPCECFVAWAVLFCLKQTKSRLDAHFDSDSS